MLMAPVVVPSWKSMSVEIVALEEVPKVDGNWRWNAFWISCCSLSCLT